MKLKINKIIMYFPNKEITIEVTNRCGAKCVMCPREKMTQKLDVMSFDVYKNCG